MTDRQSPVAAPADGAAARRPALLVFDSSYTLDEIRQKKLEPSVTCRDLRGFFHHVWTVHPFSSLHWHTGRPERLGAPAVTALAPRHTFIEGKIGRFAGLAWFPALNFLLAQLHLFARLAHLVRRHDVSVVRAGDSLVMGLWGWALSRACGVPLVVRVNGNNARQRRERGGPVMKRFFRTARIEEAAERFVLRHADLVAAVNRDNLDFALSMGARADATTIFPYGNLVSPLHFAPPHERPEGRSLLAALGLADRVFIMCVSRLEAVKLPDHAIQVLHRLRSRGIDVALLLVGGGRMQASLETLAQELDVRDHVVFAGERDQEWLSRVLPLARVILSPLTGRALTEAALAGAPMVAYDLDWQGELVRDGETGALIAPHDVAAMADAAARFISDGALAAEMGARLREAAMEMMDQERLDMHERACYEQLLGGQALAAPPPGVRPGRG